MDAPRNTDLYYRLVISECFYVGGLGAAAAAEVISPAELSDAQPDKCGASLATHAAEGLGTTLP